MSFIQLVMFREMEIGCFNLQNTPFQNESFRNKVYSYLWLDLAQRQLEPNVSFGKEAFQNASFENGNKDYSCLWALPNSK